MEERVFDFGIEMTVAVERAAEAMSIGGYYMGQHKDMYIKENEYKSLPSKSQKLFLWCPVCQHYYLREPGVCSHDI